jgi:MarR family transcriptional regulator, organic hydroperoxide resistance regulator
MDSLTQRFLDALQAFKRSFESDFLQKMSAQITGPQMFLLYFIDRQGPCKLAQLAEKMEVKPSAITVMIDRLEKSGYVTRTHGTADRRSVLVEATSLGKEVLGEAIRERNEIVGEFLTRLEPDEIRTVTVLLEKMMKMDPPKN